MDSIFAIADPYLITLYRMSGYTFIDFLVGTFLLCLFTVAVGEVTISLAYLANRKSIERTTSKAMRYQNLSVDAIEAGNKGAYKAANKLANDAFGKSFFHQIALSAGFLWPIPFALGWMQYRFFDVEFRIAFTDASVGYPMVFFALFFLAYIVFKRVKYRIPYFRRIKAMLDSTGQQHGGMRNFADLLEPTKRRRTEANGI